MPFTGCAGGLGQSTVKSTYLDLELLTDEHLLL